jgi:hypothetical protein
MGHGFGMDHDVAADLKTHYADPCCIMSQQNGFVHPIWQVNFGPALCLPHLVQRDWMFTRRLFKARDDWATVPGGITVPLAALSDPVAHANLGITLAAGQGEDRWDYFLQYIRPVEWDRGYPKATLFIRRIAAVDVGPTPIILGTLAVPANKGATAEFVETTGGVRFRIEVFDQSATILMVNAARA